MTWWEDARCKGVDTDVFDATTRAAQSVAKAYCRECPVLAQCLREAMKREDGLKPSGRYYVRGGMTPAERAEIDRVRVQVDPRAREVRGGRRRKKKVASGPAA